MKIWVAVLAILGGMAGIISGFLVTAGGEMFGESQMSDDGAAVFWLSALAIFLGFIAWKFKKVGGIGLIAISLYGFYANGLFFIFAFIFLLIAGILALNIKKKEAAV
ncbi:hypothetical protein [Halobacillus sp. Marseille-P3879]|uniref:hypothetical protein n=1 Tax=Halobacillus sp. Marseille-P3879 TaxID=2045014 RepID=UPI000C79BACC|nr:hypothetical protein [Halobacillus sp. Marseille-P3879]